MAPEGQLLQYASAALDSLIKIMIHLGAHVQAVMLRPLRRCWCCWGGGGEGGMGGRGGACMLTRHQAAACSAYADIQITSMHKSAGVIELNKACMGSTGYKAERAT